MGRQTLVQFLRDQLGDQGDEPQRAHRLIAGLTDSDVLVTTSVDRRLEQAFADAERPLDVIVGDVDVAFEDKRKAQLYKLRGTAERPESLVLTEDDYETFFEDQASLSLVLQGYLARKTILFVGYDLVDPHFKRLYRKVTVPLDQYARRAYVFGETPPRKVRSWCERHSIEVLPADATAFLESLTEQLAARARPEVPTLRAPAILDESQPLPEEPYKSLVAYEAQDQAIFCGREREIEELTALVHAHRLAVLYGDSGTGKTSLLQAGVLPRLTSADPGYAVVSVRAYADPAATIRAALRRQWPKASFPTGDAPLMDVVTAAAQAVGRDLVLVIDQFEEFFIRLSAEIRADFVAALGDLHDARELPVKVVLSLREDYLAKVGELERRIPDVFRVRMRLLPLTREQAYDAITRPVEPFGYAYQPALVERLLDDLTREGVMPPQLQLVCIALYRRARVEGRTTLTEADYESLGGAQGVLRDYLDEELRRLPPEERALARDLLAELVTSEGTKKVETVAELGTTLDIDPASLKPVLEKLVLARLLRPVEQFETVAHAYELAHEYLIAEIGVSPEAQERKQAEEIVRQELTTWRRFGTLMDEDKLAFIRPVRDELRLSTEAQELLLRSALQAGHDLAYWLRRANDAERRDDLVIEAAHSERADVRRHAAEALGILLRGAK
jgi:hypothetical protein